MEEERFREKSSYSQNNISNSKIGSSDDVIVINYCMLYAKHYIYLEKLKDENTKSGFNIDFTCTISNTYILQIEKNICTQKNQIAKFNKLKFIFENLEYVACFHMYICTNGICK